MSLFVVYVKKTGHVVGAVRAVGAGLPAVAEVVGDELPVRVSLLPEEVATLTLDAGELAVQEADDEPDVFLDPLAFGVEPVPAGQPAKPALVPLPASSKPLVFQNNGLRVEVDNPVGADTVVRAFISAGPSTTVLPGQINQGDTVTTLPTAVDDDPHGVLVLVPGWAGRLEKVEKP
ncbi:hypothetical protein [Amycolatopsis sp. NPDC098790]|uniref:hypothetical protein n=1 Tax=Amycolatopsis sp. NPDC098790 TaxID=3363939 RepID=UPI0038128771